MIQGWGNSNSISNSGIGLKLGQIGLVGFMG